MGSTWVLEKGTEAAFDKNDKQQLFFKRHPHIERELQLPAPHAIPSPSEMSLEMAKFVLYAKD